MRSFEDLLNILCDEDKNWWPFVFLRPERHEKISWWRTAFMALLYGVFSGTLLNALIKLAGEAEGLDPWIFPVGITLGCFALFRLTFMYGWNLRAARLAPLRRWTDDLADTPEPGPDVD